MPRALGVVLGAAMADVIASIEAEYRRYKALGEAAIAQMGDDEFAVSPAAGANPVSVLVWHIAGNLESRFTDFRTSDGEKPWRHRDDEFEERHVTRAELLQKWEAGWQALFTALGALTDTDLGATVTIRQQPLRVDQALHRSLAHTAYHVGQIVYLAKTLRGEGWRTLSIPRRGSEAYNRSPRDETPRAHINAIAAPSSRAAVDEIVVARAPLTSEDAVRLMAELDSELLRRYPGEPTHGLDASDENDPNAVFVVARAGGEAVACGASRTLGPGVAEIKRMYVREAVRGRGIGRKILVTLEDIARRSGVHRLRLETGVHQPEAVRLYRAAGFVEIEPYGEFVGNPLSRCFEKRL